MMAAISVGKNTSTEQVMKSLSSQDVHTEVQLQSGECTGHICPSLSTSPPFPANQTRTKHFLDTLRVWSVVSTYLLLLRRHGIHRK